MRLPLAWVAEEACSVDFLLGVVALGVLAEPLFGPEPGRIGAMANICSMHFLGFEVSL